MFNAPAERTTQKGFALLFRRCYYFLCDVSLSGAKNAFLQTRLMK